MHSKDRAHSKAVEQVHNMFAREQVHSKELVREQVHNKVLVQALGSKSAQALGSKTARVLGSKLYGQTIVCEELWLHSK